MHKLGRTYALSSFTLLVTIVVPGFVRVLWADDPETTTPGIITSRRDVNSNGPGPSAADAPSSVSLFTGEFRYAIDIQVPPGTGGIQPKLALQYASGNPSSNAGQGWTLDLPAIRRTAQFGSDKAHDSTFAQAAAERLFLYDGAALVPTDEVILDPHGCSARQFRREADLFERILHCSSGDYWTVTNREGTFMTFGRDLEGQRSRLRRPDLDTIDGTMEWYLDEVTDTHGLSWRASYHPYSQTTHAMPRLRNITYTFRRAGPGSATLVGGGRKIAFGWEYRPDGRAEQVHYGYGFPLARMHRLETIETSLADETTGASTLVRRYDLTYDADPSTSAEDYSPDSRRSMLSSVRVTAADGASLPATELTYQYNASLTDPARNSFADATQTYWPFDRIGRQFATRIDVAGAAWTTTDVAHFDLDGDGVLDLIESGTDWTIRRGSGPSIGASETFWPDGETSLEFWLADAVGNCGDLFPTSCGEVFKKHGGLLDMNGDHLVDYVGSRELASPMVHLNTGDTMGGGVSWEHGPKGHLTLSASGTSEHAIFETLIDLNGDGCPDHVSVHPGVGSWIWRRNNACGRQPENEFAENPAPWLGADEVTAFSDVPFLRHSITLTSDVQRTKTHLIDLNGDGLADLVHHLFGLPAVYLGTGRGFVVEDADSGTTYAQDLALIFLLDVALEESHGEPSYELLGTHDVNGDGLLDIVRLGSMFDGRWEVFLNVGTGFRTAPVYVPIPPIAPSFALLGEAPLQGERTEVAVGGIDPQTGIAVAYQETATEWRLVDLDGSGTPDLVRVRPINPARDDGLLYVWKSPFRHRPALLHHIDTGRGVEISVSYTTATLPSPATVVKTVQTCSVDGSDGTPSGTTCRREDYDYRDGYFERRSGLPKGFVGFGVVEVERSDDAPGTSTSYTRYTMATGDPTREIEDPSSGLSMWDGRGLAGRTVLVERGPSPTNIQTRVWNRWRAHNTAGGPGGAWAPYLERQLETDLVGGARRSRERLFVLKHVGVFDRYGRVRYVWDLGEVTLDSSGNTLDPDAGDGASFTTIEYAENGAQHVVSLPARHIVRDGSSQALLREELFRYDDLPAGGVTIGDLTERREAVAYPGEPTVWASTSYAYDEDATSACPAVGNVTRVTDPEGAVTQLGYNAGSCAYKTRESIVVNGTAHTTTHEWDERFGVETRTTDPNGRVTRRILDGFGRPTRVLGTPPQDPGAAEILLETFEYDDHVIPNRVNHQQVAGFGLWTLTQNIVFLDGFGRPVQSKQLQERSDCSLFGGCDTLRYATTNRQYDHTGNVARESLPYETFDGSFDPVDFRSGGWLPAPTRTTLRDWAGRETFRSLRLPDGSSRYPYRTSYGLWSSTTWHDDPEITGKKRIHHDAHGRVVMVEELDGGIPRGKVTHEYDLLGNVTHQYFTDLETGEVEPGTVTTYDSRGLSRTRVDPNLNNCDDPAACPTRLVYDLNGRLVQTVDAKAQKIDYTLDELGRVTYTDYCPGQMICRFNYDVVRTYDAPGALGRLWRVDPMGGIANEVTFGYDNWGRVISETRTIHDRTATTDTEYDYLGRPTRLVYPSASGAQVGGEGGPLMGDLGTVTDVNVASTQTSGYHFKTKTEDAFATHLCGYFTGTKPVRLWNRATGELLAEATVTNTVTLAAGQWECAELTTPVYLPASSSFTVATAMGGSGGVQRSGVSYPFSPNELAEVEAATWCASGSCRPTIALRWATASTGQADVRLRSAADVREEVRITYGVSGRAESIYWHGGDHGTGSPPSRWIAENIMYDPMGRMIRADWGNGLRTLAYYRSDYQKLDYLQVLAPYAVVPSGELYRLTYDYWPDGNIRSVASDGQGNFTESYHYDYAVRLVGADHAAAGSSLWDLAYDYEANGNLRVQIDSVTGRLDTYAYELDATGARVGGPHAVARFNETSTYDYDANGQMALNAVDGSSYWYNAEHSLRLINQPVAGCDPSTTQLHRDGDQVTRLRSTSGGCEADKMVYTFGPHYEVVVEDPGGAAPAITHDRYVYLDGVRVAHIRGGSLQLLHNNHLGTATLITGAGGEVVDFRKYRPFGSEYDDANGDTSGHRYGFTGAEELNGIYSLGVREYTPESGRMNSPDTIIPDPLNPQSFNRYAYAYNNPIRYTDPSGYCPDCELPDAPSSSADVFDDPFVEGALLDPEDPKSVDLAPTGGGNDAPEAYAMPTPTQLGSTMRNARSVARPGYEYTTEGIVGFAYEGVTPENAMAKIQQEPNSVFPFTVKPRDGGDSTIRLGGQYDLNNTRYPGDVGNGVEVVEVTGTSFTFLTLDDHFDGPGATIRFRTFDEAGRVYLQHIGHAPDADLVTSAVAPLGAQQFMWPQMRGALREHLRMDGTIRNP